MVWFLPKKIFWGSEYFFYPKQYSFTSFFYPKNCFEYGIQIQMLGKNYLPFQGFEPKIQLQWYISISEVPFQWFNLHFFKTVHSNKKVFALVNLLRSRTFEVDRILSGYFYGSWVLWSVLRGFSNLVFTWDLKHWLAWNKKKKLIKVTFNFLLRVPILLVKSSIFVVSIADE